MNKNFNAWNEEKKKLEEVQEKFLFREGEIWWCAIGANIGNESCGKGDTFRRPIIILKKLSEKCCIGIPLSTQKKVGTWFCDIKIMGGKQTALLYQIKMFNSNRFQRRLTTLEKDDFLLIKQKLESLLELSHNHQDLG